MTGVHAASLTRRVGTQGPLLAVVLGAAAVAGAAATSVPPAVAGAALAAALIAPLVLQRPELGVGLLVLLVAGIPQTLLFRASAGPVKVTDLLLLLTVGSWVLMALAWPDSVRLPSRGVTFSVVAFLVWSVASLYTARGHGTALKVGLNELRPLVSLALVFPIVSRVRDMRTLIAGLYVLLVAGALSAVVTIADYVSGHGQAASFADGATRVIGTPLVYMIVGAVLALMLFAYRDGVRARVALLLLAALDLTGLFFTLQRSAFVAVVVALPLVFLVTRPSRRLTMMTALVALLAVTGLVVLGWGSASSGSSHNLLRSGADRVASLSLLQEDVSAGHRVFEWREAGQEIAAHPVTGIGLGSSITFWSPLYDPVTKRMGGIYTEYYIHSSYVWLALKLGIVGAVLYLGLLVMVGARALSLLLRARSDEVRILTGGAFVTLVALGVLAIAGPHLTQTESTLYIACVIGAVEVVRRLVREGKAA